MSTQLIENHLAKRYLVIFGGLAVLIGALLGAATGMTANTVLLVVISIGLAIVILSLVNLEFGLMVFIAMTYLRVSDIAVHNYHAPSIARLFLILLFIAILLRWASSGDLPKGWMTVATLVVAYGVIVFGSLLYANDFASAQLAVDDYWKDGLIAILVVFLIQKKSTFRYVIWVLILTGIFMGTLSVIQTLTGTYSNSYWGFAQAPLLNIVGNSNANRVAGPIGDPNFYCQILIVLVPLAINRMANEKPIILKILAAFALLVITLSIVFTYSRGGFFALLVALIILGLYQPPRISLTLSMVGVALIIIMMLPPSFIDRMGTVTGLISGNVDIRSEVSFRGRASEYIVAWEMFSDHPILGVGKNNYPLLYQDYSKRIGLDPRTTPREPHNLYLEVAAETGILGLLVFALVIYFVFRSTIKARKKFKEIGDLDTYQLIGAFSAGFVGYLTAALFIHSAYPRYFWLLVGIAMALPNIANNDFLRSKPK